MKKLILASTSKYRKQLLDQLHWPFETAAPAVDEDLYKQQNLAPQELAEKLSQLKAQAVLKQHPEAVVIGSDQVCALGDVIFSKPHNFENALKQLQLMAGREHKLLTAVTITDQNQSYTWTNATSLSMRALTESDITRYLEIDTPYDCAGSYKLESMGIKLFHHIEMSDHTSIIGLPLIEITNALMDRFGFKF